MVNKTPKDNNRLINNQRKIIYFIGLTVVRQIRNNQEETKNNERLVRENDSSRT